MTLEINQVPFDEMSVNNQYFSLVHRNECSEAGKVPS